MGNHLNLNIFHGKWSPADFKELLKIVSMYCFCCIFIYIICKIGQKVLKFYCAPVMLVLNIKITSLSYWFSIITLQIYREILKKYRKGALTLEKKQFFKNLKKMYWMIHMRNIMPKFQNCRLNCVAKIERTSISTND